MVTALVAYFTQFLPKTYTVSTSIYTGIVSGSSIMDEDTNVSIQSVSNSFDNLINLMRAQSTLENVSMQLFAMNMIHGNPQKDNEYITAQHFIELDEMVPDEVRRAIDKKSMAVTLANLKKINKTGNSNFMYLLLNGSSPYYSYEALNKVQIYRIQNSDMLEISYSNNDPGITTNTVKLFNEELLKSYNDLRYNSTNDVIAYFERECAKLKAALNQKEDILTEYNVANSVINYEEQTKFIANALINYEDRYEEAQKRQESSYNLHKTLEKQMDTRTKLFKTNTEFINSLEEISTLKGKITDIELFTSENAQQKDIQLKEFKTQLRKKEADIASLSKDLDIYKYSREGLAIDDLAQQWIMAMIDNTKVNAEMKILDARRLDFDEKYARFSPVGTEIKRRERDITVTENSYLRVLHALNMAYLRKKNIQLTTSNLNTITEPKFPLYPNKSKRMMYIVAAFFGSLIFITMYKLVIELLDRTLRDGERTQRLTGIKPIGAMVGRGELRYRGYSKTWNRIAATYIANKLDKDLNVEGTSYINVLSIDKKEGKSYFIKFISEEWERLGLKVKIIEIGEDKLEKKEYSLATDFSFLITPEEAKEYNIILIEYPAIISNPLPKNLVHAANLNIIVANAKRVWKKCDGAVIDHFKEVAGSTPYVLVLNNAERYDVEDYTGNLLPDGASHKFSLKLMHMGLTSKGPEIK